MEFTANHSLAFTTQGDVPVPVVARSLVSNERLIHEGFRVLGDLYPQLQTARIRIKVSELTNASPLREVFTVAVVVSFQDDLEKEVPDLIEAITGAAVPGSADVLVTVLVLMVATYLVDRAVMRLLPQSSTDNLKKELNEKINLVAEMLGVESSDVDRALEQRYQEKSSRTLARKAQQFFKPAKIEPGVEITSDSGQGIGAPAINDIPSEIDLARVEDFSSYELRGVAVEIHRADRDTYKYGWRAIIETVSEKKVRTELSQDIPPEQLYGSTHVVGDVIVIEERQEDGSSIPKTYHLVRVKESFSE